MMNLRIKALPGISRLLMILISHQVILIITSYITLVMFYQKIQNWDLTSINQTGKYLISLLSPGH